jgi:hypothetical protein
MSIAPTDLAAWGLHCFCITARQTPQSIVRLDHNGDLLHRAAGGVPLAVLRSEGLVSSDSQIRLLQAFGLLRQIDDMLITTFPIIGPEAIVALRARIAKVTEGLAETIAADARAMQAALADAGHADSAYAVLFGYALDGLLWNEPALRNVLPDAKLDLDHPFWRGTFWAVYPDRTGAPGTNEAVEGRASFVTVWTDDLALDLRNETVIGPVRAACRGIGKNPGSGPAAPAPVIRAVCNDPIHRLASRIVAAIARWSDSRSG